MKSVEKKTGKRGTATSAVAARRRAPALHSEARVMGTEGVLFDHGFLG
ncbi:MAG: hypothetical protein HY302_12175 [Opitutae bacterium]|nr:hypothetical protein [Opitutae bacterium]